MVFRSKLWFLVWQIEIFQFIGKNIRKNLEFMSKCVKTLLFQVKIWSKLWFLVLQIGNFQFMSKNIVKIWSKLWFSGQNFIKIVIFGLTDRNFSVYRPKNSQNFGFNVKMCQNFFFSGQNLIKIWIFGLTDRKCSVYRQKIVKICQNFGFKVKICHNWFWRSKLSSFYAKIVTISVF